MRLRCTIDDRREPQLWLRPSSVYHLPRRSGRSPALPYPPSRRSNFILIRSRIHTIFHLDFWLDATIPISFRFLLDATRTYDESGSWVHLFVLQALDNHLVELFGLAARHAERFPAGRFQIFGQEDYLTDMRGVVSQLAIDRLENSVRLLEDRHGSHHVFGSQRFNRVEHISPPLLPPF